MGVILVEFFQGNEFVGEVWIHDGFVLFEYVLMIDTAGISHIVDPGPFSFDQFQGGGQQIFNDRHGIFNADYFFVLGDFADEIAGAWFVVDWHAESQLKDWKLL